MKTTQHIFLAAAVSALVCAGPHLFAQTSNRGVASNKYSGTVTDADGQPVPGATVEYWHAAATASSASDLELKKQLTTGADGAYEIEAARDIGFVVARKAGLAPAWLTLIPELPAPSGAQKLVLTPPGALAGTVVDESNQPVANAEVSVVQAFGEMQTDGNTRPSNFLLGKPARDSFTARTDAAGRFRLENFPTNASAVFDVQVPGKVLHSEPLSTGAESPGYRVGDTNIKLILEPAGRVEGKMVCSESNQTPPAARLMLQSDQPSYFSRFGKEPVKSDPDGAFRFREVPAGDYHVRAMFGTNAESEWVAEPVKVLVEAGKVARDIQITAQRGTLLEIAVLGKEDRKPVPAVTIIAYRQNSQVNGLSDSNGVARLHLLPGDYQIIVARKSGQSVSSQTSATVQFGKTNRTEIEIAAPKIISGIVHTPAGQPAAHIPMQLIGGNGGNRREFQTDAAGKFEVEWNQRQYVGPSDSTACILARDAEHNLAVAQDLDEETGALDLKLAPALTLAGRVEFEGKPITNATAALVFWTGRSGQWLQGLARTNTPGQFEIPALPPGRKYGVIISAPGYGQKQNHSLEISAEPGRQELDLVELKPANLKLSGQVLNADEKPVAGCYVNMNGEDQPSGNVRTDKDGRFTFAHVCEGTVQLSANSQSSFGNVRAEGGDTNVVLQLGQNSSSSTGEKPHKLTGVVMDTDGKPAIGVRVAVLPDNGTRWVKTGTNGEFSLNWSLQSWQLQNGGAHLVVLDRARNLAGTEELSEEITNLNVKLKPAVTFSGRVKSIDGPAPAGAQVTLWIKIGNSYLNLDESGTTPVSAAGRFEITCLPPDAQYMVSASAKGYGKQQRNLSPEYETNQTELEPFVLQHADRMIAGQILKDDDKPASGVNIQLSGNDQPDGNMTTDSKGRFHFQVCEGQIRLFAYAQNGGGNAQTTVEAGDTNIVMNLTSSSGSFRATPRRASLQGGTLPDLMTVNLAADAAPAGKPVLLCLFDAGQRPSRNAIRRLNEQATALRSKNLGVLGLQAAITSDEMFNEWKTNSAVSFPVGRVTNQSDQTKWATSVTTLPWLILADANHRVVAEGFPLGELEAQIQKLAK